MPMELETSDSVESGNFLDKPGTYHLYVMEAEEQPMSKEGKLIDGLRFQCATVAGTTAGQDRKTIQVTINHPSPTHKDGGEFAKRLRTRFLWAIGFIDKLGEKITFDAEKAKGRQFVATLEPSQNPKYLQIAGMHVWHVDDPDAKAFPRSEQALALLPKELRRSADYFKSIAPGNGSTAAVPAKAAPVKQSSINLDDL